MNPQSRVHLAIRIFFILAVSAFAIAIVKTQLARSTTQSSNEPRQLLARMPETVPIKVKIKKEKQKAFSDPANEHWARDFELEVKNVGEKPIYYLSLFILLPEIVMPDGNPYGFGLRYGRLDFERTPGTVPQPDEIPITPGETYIFTIPKFKIDGYENRATREKLTPPKKIELFFDYLSFGDDTGFETPTGIPVNRRKPVGVLDQRNTPTRLN